MHSRRSRLANGPLVMALLAAAALLAADAGAGTITGLGATAGPGLGSASPDGPVMTALVNDDNSAAPNNSAPIRKIFSAPGYIDVEFLVAGSDGVTEYVISDFISNQSGQGWSDFNLQLGFGVGAAFVPSGPGDGLDFDFPDQDPAASFAQMTFPFTSIVAGEDTIDYLGGVVPSGQGGTFRLIFNVDVPDVAAFTIRQTPIPAPEPAALALAALGLAAIALRRRSR